MLRALGIDCDTVDVAGTAGYAFVMAFPTPTDPAQDADRANRFVLGHAVQPLQGRSAFKRFGSGLGAYDRWIEALEKNRADVVRAMNRIAERLPFPPDGEVEDEAKRAEA